jgi:hypothetical protein
LAALGFDFLIIIVYIINFGIVLFCCNVLLTSPFWDVGKRRQVIVEGLSPPKGSTTGCPRTAEFEKSWLAREFSSRSQKAAEATERMRQDILAAAQKRLRIKARARPKPSKKNNKWR